MTKIDTCTEPAVSTKSCKAGGKKNPLQARKKWQEATRCWKWNQDAPKKDEQEENDLPSPMALFQMPVTSKVDLPVPEAPEVVINEEETVFEWDPVELPEIAVPKPPRIEGPAQPVFAPLMMSRQELPVPVTRTEAAPVVVPLIVQMASAVREVMRTERTEMVVELKHPPLLEGARLIVTEFDTAKGEYNITLENLSSEAQAVIAAPENRLILDEAMQQRGFHVHILIASTIEDISFASAETGFGSHDREQGQEEREEEQ